MGILSSKRRTVQIFMINEDRVQLVKEVNTPEQPCAVSLDGYFLCLALTTQYMILNYNTGANQDLFPYNSEERKPIVKRIAREEFLLAAPGGLGMFANAQGVSQRAPVNWSESVIGAAVCFPYVVALDESFITVHSMLDQQLKQTLPFRDGHILQDFEGKVILASTKAVYILVPLPLERQIQDLLASHRVEEALFSLKEPRGISPKKSFRKGQLDVRELISLYPLLLPSSSSFTRCHPPLHEFADLNHLAQGDQEKVQRCKRFLISYLGEVRSTEVANGCREDVDTALLKLYAEQNHDSLLDLLASENFCVLADCVPWLEKYHKYFALGLLHQYHGQDSAALQLWIRVADGDLQDDTRSDLFEYIVDFLCSCSSLDLLWKYADWVLRRNPTTGVQIFTKRISSKNQVEPSPDDVVTYLTKHREALLLYLEHLVLERQIQKETFHTHLAVLYLERVLALLSETPPDEAQLTKARERLQAMLRESSLYRVQYLLGKIENCENLLLERATLHGKLEEHDKALHILVHQLKDFKSAEAYCLWASETRDSAYRQKLFHLLLGAATAGGGGELEMAAVDLLNRHGEVFDAVRVLNLLPESWSLQLLKPFLGRAVRASVHACRTSQIALGLARSEHVQLLHDRLKETRKPILVSDKKGCFLCHNTFSEPEVVCLPGECLSTRTVSPTESRTPPPKNI
ncbi:hypothetical protein WMY93_019178 [Mugilogobius chulae]|uniref:CNH domain-containing protein n=1 Tax=Mugilogobius chulae TaxID=88201 RepID=A0AAW0NID0_9GOBI